MKKKEYKKRIEKEKRELREYRESNAGMNPKTFTIIAICVIGFVFLMFTFTKIKTGEWNLFTKKNAVTYTAEVQDIKILCGSILNREEEEYFVLAYDMSSDDASLYETLSERYGNLGKGGKLYKLDLGNSRNNICLGDNINIVNDVKSLKLVKPSLIKVKNEKIIENYTSYSDIKNTLLSYVD